MRVTYNYTSPQFFALTASVTIESTEAPFRDRPIWLFWGRYRHIGHSWTDSQYFQNF